MWGALEPIPLIQDEYSYVLQSRIFATGHWTAPSPPVPQFFEQPHVLVVPAVASKFFPGTALLMAVGALVGATVLVPLLLTALTGALLFGLARRISNVWVAVFTVLIWLGDPLNLRFRAGYFSETTTEAMWFLACWSLLEWRASRRGRWLVALGLALAWGAITRPLSMLALALPIAVVVVRDVARCRLWKEFGIAAACGLLILAIVPLWSKETTGDWRLTPQSLYTRDYLPFDRPGFGADSTPPRRELNPVNRFVYEDFFREHVRHTPANLPRIAVERLAAIGREEFGGPRRALIPFVVVGLFAINGAVVVALASGLFLFVAYLGYAHFAPWTLYYFEAMPVLALLGALGIWRVADGIRKATRLEMYRPFLGVALSTLVLLTGVSILRARADHERLASWDVAFRESLSKLPMRAAVIFVHYAPGLRPHANVVRNSPALADEPIWIVHDLGERNRELMRFAGPRIPLAFYEDGGRFEIDRTLLR